MELLVEVAAQLWLRATGTGTGSSFPTSLGAGGGGAGAGTALPQPRTPPSYYFSLAMVVSGLTYMAYNLYMLYCGQRGQRHEVSYDGDYDEAGAYHGVGTLVLSDGDKYVGMFDHGQYHGEGTYTFAKTGTLFHGEFKQGAVVGTGKELFSDGGWYHGGFRAGKRNLVGTLSRSPREGFVGGWRDGLREGPGVEFLRNGARFEGRWRAGLRDGPGVTITVTGERLVSEWRANECVRGDSGLSEAALAQLRVAAERAKGGGATASLQPVEILSLGSPEIKRAAAAATASPAPVQVSSVTQRKRS